MFGEIGDLFAFEGGDIVFCVLILVLDVVTLYFGRTFFKKI